MSLEEYDCREPIYYKCGAHLSAMIALLSNFHYYIQWNFNPYVIYNVIHGQRLSREYVLWPHDSLYHMKNPVENPPSTLYLISLKPLILIPSKT